MGTDPRQVLTGVFGFTDFRGDQEPASLDPEGLESRAMTLRHKSPQTRCPRSSQPSTRHSVHE